METYQIAVIPGDGIGTEVISGGLTVLQRAAELTGSFALKTTEYPWSCEWYLAHGRMMPEDGLERLRDAEALYLGAVGFPGVADHISLRGLLLPIRFGFDQYVNLRPIELFEGITGPLRDRGPSDIDIVCIRENTEGEYAGLGGRFPRGVPTKRPSRRRSSRGGASNEWRATRSRRRGGGAGSSPVRPSPTRCSTALSCGTR
jgi:tartrate dehydrogenase/decarboxylase/D-malate dehydrogenase